MIKYFWNISWNNETIDKNHGYKFTTNLITIILNYLRYKFVTTHEKKILKRYFYTYKFDFKNDGPNFFRAVSLLLCLRFDPAPVTEYKFKYTVHWHCVCSAQIMEYGA
uniref:Uncharacterized protein n=1 Tax=Sipha flava TaxID=143950 RepID=A0A2S2R4Z3_9HEMI